VRRYNLEATTGSWDVYGAASNARYPAPQEAFFEAAATGLAGEVIENNVSNAERSTAFLLFYRTLTHTAARLASYSFVVVKQTVASHLMSLYHSPSALARLSSGRSTSVDSLFAMTLLPGPEGGHVFVPAPRGPRRVHAVHQAAGPRRFQAPHHAGAAGPLPARAR
jgi:hypothetical protein